MNRGLAMAFATYYLLGIVAVARLKVMGLILLAPCLTLGAAAVIAGSNPGWLGAVLLMIGLTGAFAAGALTLLVVSFFGGALARQ